jgi:hypothetical protein
VTFIDKLFRPVAGEGVSIDYQILVKCLFMLAGLRPRAGI